MTLAAPLVAELDRESLATRALLERAPEDHFGWRPHEKSLSLAQLASHIAHLPKWVRITVETDALDVAKALPPNPEADDQAELLDVFEASLVEARDALDGVDDAVFAESWALRHGETTIFEAPKAVVLRTFVLSHLIHHRGQMSVYLRLLDIPLPPIYGPTADDRAGFG